MQSQKNVPVNGVAGHSTIDDDLFDERGQLNNSIREQLDREGHLEGEEAIALLAELLANQTMENYEGKTLYDRAKIGEHYRVTIEKL